MASELPTISLWQPFASLIFWHDPERGARAKTHETRSFKLPARLVGEWVAIHATAVFPAHRMISPELHRICVRLFGIDYRTALPLGAVLGKVRFDAAAPTDLERVFQCDGEQAAGDWTNGRYAWPIIETEAWTPRPMKGKQGWWKHEPEQEA